MREVFAHQAVVDMPVDGDVNAPGAAITVSLCGHWDHDPPCRLAPHHTQAERSEDEVSLRVLFAVEPGNELLVRERIDGALGAGVMLGPDGVTTPWKFLSSRRDEVQPGESDHAQRLINS